MGLIPKKERDLVAIVGPEVASVSGSYRRGRGRGRGFFARKEGFNLNCEAIHLPIYHYKNR